MIRPLRALSLLLAASLSAFAAAPLDSADASLAPELGFEIVQDGDYPAGWRGGPPETNHIDTSVVHSGKAAARIERTSTSPRNFSSLTKALTIDFAGQRLELRGWIRTEAVSGFAGLWLREDGPDGTLEFDNMQSRRLRGTNDWAEYSISLPVHPGARGLFFGFLLNGTGKAWVDDLQLLVDGKPIWQAAKIEWAETVFDRDHEFDDGSKVTLSALTPGQIENLATLARVWGFLKYHHPTVTRGELHWDYELFRLLPRVLAARDQAAANATLLNWIDRLGPLEFGVRSSPPEEEIALRPDLAWLDDNVRVGEALSARLRAVRDTRFTGQFYVSLVPGVGNPVFKNEPAYPDMRFPDAGYQLLGLFRLWNIIRYWSPYRDLVDGEWDATLTEFIPRIALAPSKDAYQLELMAFIARISDTHANLWSSLQLRPPVGEGELPVVVRFVEGQAVVTEVLPTPDKLSASLQHGDVIVAIDNTPVDEWVRRWSPFYAASNEPTRLRDIARVLTRGPLGPVKLRIRRGSDEFDIGARRLASAELPEKRRTHDLPGPTFHLLSRDVAYLKLSSVKAADVSEYLRQAGATQGWIIDLRNYPAEAVLFDLGALFVDHGTPFARFTQPNLENPGQFSFTGSASLSPERPPGRELARGDSSNILSQPTFAAPVDFPQWNPQSQARYTGKIVVLVDEVTQSAAEYTAMALRAAGAVVVGSMTAGADGNVAKIPLPGGLHTMISGIGVYYPDKRPTQRIGIVPDVKVEPTIAGIRAARDELLEEALRQILGPTTSPDEILRLAAPHAD